jgi:hypothetical protein
MHAKKPCRCFSDSVVWIDLVQAPAAAASMPRQSAMARWSRNFEISPPLSSLLEKNRDRGSTVVWARMVISEQRAGWRGAGGPHNAIADQPRQPAVRI